MTDALEPPRGSDEREYAASCWSCGAGFDAATAMSGKGSPDAGDVTVCLYCAALGVFTGSGIEQRQPTEAERAELMADSSVARAVGAVLTATAVDPKHPNRRLR